MIFSNLRDTTHRPRGPQETPAPYLSFMCGHKGLRAGALMRGYTPWKCANCAKESK